MVTRGFKPLPPDQTQVMEMISENQRNYLEEYEKYKHIAIACGFYFVRARHYLVYEVVDVDNENETATLQREGFTMVKTLHWCRKKLAPKETK